MIDMAKACLILSVLSVLLVVWPEFGEIFGVPAIAAQCLSQVLAILFGFVALLHAARKPDRAKNVSFAAVGVSIGLATHLITITIMGMQIASPRTTLAARALGDMYTLMHAAELYRDTTGVWPIPQSVEVDPTYGPGSQRIVIDLLAGTSEKGGRSFLKLDAALIRNGELVDAWGNAYFIAFDTDGDGDCATAGAGLVKGHRVCVWTQGPVLRSWDVQSAGKRGFRLHLDRGSE
jgi:hypothetical protein